MTVCSYLLKIESYDSPLIPSFTSTVSFQLIFEYWQVKLWNIHGTYNLLSNMIISPLSQAAFSNLSLCLQPHLPSIYYPHCKEFLKCKWYFQCFLDKIQSCSCPTMDCSLPGSSVHGISQARILEWVAISSPGYLPNPGIKPVSPALQADPLPLSNLRSPWIKVLEENLTLHCHHARA